MIAFGRWALNATLVFAATAPMYFLATWCVGAQYFAHANSDQMGWAIILWPLFFVPPLLPWLAAAAPVAAAFTTPSIGWRAGLGFAAFIGLVGPWQALVRPAVSAYGNVSETLSLGTLPPTVFATGVFVLAGVMAAVLHRTRATSPRS